MFRAIAVAALLAMPIAGAYAQADYPSKPVRVVIGFPPGGPTDIVGRPVAARLAQVTGQSFVIENRAGANGILAADYVAKSAPDGYTIYLATTGALLSPILSPKLSYDLFRDFAPVALVATVPALLAAHPSLPVKSARDLAVLAKAKPGQLAYASSGNASMGNLGFESFKLAAGINILHVPYKGAAPAMTDLMGGHVQVSMLSLSILQPQVQAGKLRALAMVSSKRAATLPDVPSMAESGYPDVNAYYIAPGDPVTLTIPLVASQWKSVNGEFADSSASIPAHARVRLDLHFRSHNLIADYCNDAFYSNTLSVVTILDSITVH